jgi:acyl-homoserine lactone acylase PvdQ
MYAQAEDNFCQLETDTIRAIGRRAEIDGAAAFPAILSTAPGK